MAILSPEQFSANIKPRSIIYFSDRSALNTSNPHYFICIGSNSDGELIFSCCTSQFNTVSLLIERKRFSNTTLVFISKDDDENPFTLDTYVNCNEYFPYLLSELWDMYNRGKLTLHGELPLDSFDQILTGFRNSTQIEQDLKETLPTIDDFP